MLSKLFLASQCYGQGGFAIKLLFVFAAPTGGMETLNRQRCAALEQRGAVCHLLYLKTGAGLRNIRSTDITTHITDDDGEIRDLLRNERYDAIAATFDYGLLSRIRMLGYTGPLIFEVQGLGNIEGARRILTDAGPHIHKHASAILFPKTPHLHNLIHQYYPQTRKFSFHNCIDSIHFAYRKRLVPPYPVIGWVGRIEYIKNWRYFLDIISQLVQIRPSLKVWIFEDRTLAPDNEAFEQTVRQYGLQQHIVRHSNIPHEKMADYYSVIGDSGGVLLSTSIMEGFGYAQLEAMLCRCPVVTTDSDGVKSFLKHDVTGKFIPHENAGKAVQTILELMDNRALRDSIRQTAGKQIAKQFSYKAYSTHFFGMLRELGVRVPWRGWRFWS